MFERFLSDLAATKPEEAKVLQVMSRTTNEYTFSDVSNDAKYYKLGDIDIYDDLWDMHYYMDTKTDGVIHQTGNILAERRTWKAGRGWLPGFMQDTQYDYVAYHSPQSQTIWVLDFSLWKKYYQNYSHRHLAIPHYDSKGNIVEQTDGFLMSLKTAKKLKIIIAEIHYEKREDGYWPTDIIQ